MRLYWEVAKRSFQRQLAYRAATLAGLVTNAFFGYLRGAVFMALFATRPEVAGWDVRDALTYTWLTQALIMIVQLWGWWEVADNIKTGDVASDLAKPFDYYAFWLARDLGRACYHLLARGLPTFLIGFLFYDLLLPPTPLIWLLLAVTLLFAVVMSFAFRFIINVAAFWLLDTRGVGYRDRRRDNLPVRVHGPGGLLPRLAPGDRGLAALHRHRDAADRGLSRQR